jgi:hypothetical protein
MREFKCRSWISSIQKFVYFENGNYSWKRKIDNIPVFNWDNAQQYTGLKDKKGVEIYEFMEIDNQYEVQFLNGCYVLINISNDDIITLSTYLRNNNGKATVTREYKKV